MSSVKQLVRVSLVMVGLTIGFACRAQAQPSIATDQADYPPGSTVTITGSGFQAGESVQCQVLRIDIDENAGFEHDPWQFAADADGNFTTTWYVTEDEAGALLQLTGLGLSSGLTAQTTFTDAGIAQRGSATNATTTSTSLTINKPSGIVAGDVMIVNIAQRGNNTAAPSLTGWTLIDGRSLAGGTARYGAVLYRVAGATEGASYTFTLGSGSSSAVGDIVAFSGVDTSGTTPFDVPTGTISVQASSTAVSATAITTASANAAVIMFGMAGNSAPTWSGWTNKVAGGALTELYDNQSTTASVGAAWAIKATAGSTGAGAATLSASQRNGAILIALKPRTASTTTLAAGGSSTYGQAVTFTATVTPTNATGTVNFYDGATLLGSGTLSGTTTKTASYTTTGTPLSAGTHSSITAAYQGDAGRNASTSAAITQTVATKALTVTADARSKTYGGADPTLTYQITSGSLLGSDSLSGSLTRVAGETLGTYAIQQGTVAASGSYTITYVPANLTITPRPITVTAVPDNKLYDGTDTSSGVPTNNVGDLVNGDTGTWTQRFNTNNTTATTLIPAGSIDGGKGGNYSITFVSVPTQSIHPRGVTVTANDATRVYGAPNPTFDVSYSGFIPGEGSAVVSGTPNVSTVADGSSNVGQYDLNVATNALAALNYRFNPAKGKLTITPASASVGVASDKWTVPPTNTVSFTVSASAVSPSVAIPSGSVQFVANGTNNLGSPISLVNGQASLSVLGSALVHGSNTVTAVFSDANGNFNGSSGNLNPGQVVNIPPNGRTHSMGAALNKPITMLASSLGSADTDADADQLTVTAVSSTSTNGGTITLLGGVVTYTPVNNYVGTDRFTYTVSDPFEGTTTSTASVTVRLGAVSSIISSIKMQSDGSVKVIANGIAGKSYIIQASTDLFQTWANLSTNVAAANALILYIDTDAPNHALRSYRLALP